MDASARRVPGGGGVYKISYKDNITIDLGVTMF